MTCRTLHLSRYVQASPLFPQVGLEYRSTDTHVPTVQGSEKAKHPEIRGKPQEAFAHKSDRDLAFLTDMLSDYMQSTLGGKPTWKYGA